MSADKKPYSPPTEKELLDYLDGKVKGERANELERYLLSSEFDEEAMEGLSSTDTRLLKEDLKKLRSGIESKSTKKDFSLFNLAAGIAFLLVSMTAIWFVVDKALPNDRISMKTDSTQTKAEADQPMVVMEQETSAQGAPVEEEITEEEITDEVVELAASEGVDSSAALEPVLAESVKADSLLPDTIVEPGDNALALAEDIKADLPKDSAGLEYDYASGIAQQSFSEPEKRTKKAENSSLNATGAVSRAAAPPQPETISRINGTVYYREDREPLPGVHVTANDKTTVTGLDGRFVLQDLDSGTQIRFSAVGLKNKVVEIDDSEPLTVLLEPDVSSLEEVVVVGYGENNNHYGIKSPEPRNGRAAFKAYLERSLRYPAAAKQNLVSGVVLLKLTVSSEGIINNIEVKKSLGSGCDEEAKRLVREGPEWTPALYNGEPVEGTVRVRVKFELP